MKNSTKFVWIVFGSIAVILIVLTVMLRSIVSEHVVVSDNGGAFSFVSDSGPGLSENYNIKDFNEIKAIGGWDVLVIASEDYSVTAEIRESVKNDIIIKKKGDALYLSLGDPENAEVKNFHGASVTVYMPELNAVDVTGAVNMHVEGFDVESMNFTLGGAGQIIGEDCNIENLYINSAGAVNVDFTDSFAENAEVYVAGAGNVELVMNGGELTGKLSGFSNLEYSGSVSLLDVAEDGISNIKRRDN